MLAGVGAGAGVARAGAGEEVGRIAPPLEILVAVGAGVPLVLVRPATVHRQIRVPRPKAVANRTVVLLRRRIYTIGHARQVFEVSGGGGQGLEGRGG